MLSSLLLLLTLILVAPYRRDTAILSLRYPISHNTFFREFSTPPQWCDTPPWYLVSHRHICAIPHFATYRAIIVRYPTKTSTKYICDTIVASIARYEKYRCWASKTLIALFVISSVCIVDQLVLSLSSFCLPLFDFFLPP